MRRPKRQVAERAAFRGQLSESLELVALQEYRGPVASGSAGSQPFSVEIADAVRHLRDPAKRRVSNRQKSTLGRQWCRRILAFPRRILLPAQWAA